MLALLFTDTGQRNEASQTFVLPAHPITVGRRPECDLVFADRTVSGRHARITRQAGQGLVTDLNSTNGTLINGKRAAEGRIVPGDKIRFGQFDVQVLNIMGGGDSVAAEESVVLATKAQLVVLQGSTAGRTLEIDKPIWKLGSNGGPQLVFVRRHMGWSVTLLDGVGTLKINGTEVTHMPMPLNNQDHIVYEGIALQFRYA